MIEIDMSDKMDERKQTESDICIVSDEMSYNRIERRRQQRT